MKCIDAGKPIEDVCRLVFWGVIPRQRFNYFAIVSLVKMTKQIKVRLAWVKRYLAHGIGTARAICIY
jgi:hypothetical protein